MSMQRRAVRLGTRAPLTGGPLTIGGALNDLANLPSLFLICNPPSNQLNLSYGNTCDQRSE